MSPKPDEVPTNAEEIVEDRVDLHHHDNRREAAAGATEADEGDTPIVDDQDVSQNP